MQSNVCWHASPYPSPNSAKLSEPLPSSLARAVELWPDRPAVLYGEERFSFADLWQRVAGLAEEIQTSSTAFGPIALVQSIGLDSVAAWFACALSRRPLLLLEPEHPPARLAELITAAGATLILCDHATIDSLPEGLSVERLVSDGRRVPTHPGEMLGSDEPAMIFPTSGSTGRPKLVVYTSRTLQAKVQASISLMKVPCDARVLIAGSHGNYGFLHHALVFLLSGGALCLANVKADGFSGLLDTISRLKVRHVRFTPSMFRTFARLPEAQEILRCLEAVRFSGEPLLKSDLDLAHTVVNPDCLIQNVYGSTESALFIWNQGDEMDPAAGTVPIGHVYPLSSYALKPLEDAAHDADTGELLIRSAFHAIGDLKAGAIDPNRFPFDRRCVPERIYATGDIVRQLPNGSLVLLGRMSRMVKIRGQKVFLSEVENHLRAMPGVTGAAVVERKEGDGTSLIGFVTLADDAEAPLNARSWLASRLPDFMLPRQILATPQIPLLEGGKVDYRALLAELPDPSDVPVEVPAEIAHGGDFGRLEQIWQSTLGWGADDLNNDFFALGGDSLKLMELGLAIERDFVRRLPVEEFIADPTLPGLARLLGIDAFGHPGSTRRGLRLRFVHPARRQSKGVALAMPGFHGSALVANFLKAGLFSDYDIWAADDPLEAGNMAEEKRWLRSTLQIVEQLRQGAAPAPKVIFGYSIGGSIAWLVGRLLAGTPQSPDLVVMVDAAPLHRMRSFCNAELRRALASAPVDDSPPVLHIRREPLAAVGIEPGGQRLWRPEDNIKVSIDLPTIDHGDMARADVLALAAEYVSAALNDHTRDLTRRIPPGTIPTYGGRVYQALATHHTRGTTDISQLLENLPRWESSVEVLYLVLRDGTKVQARTFLEKSIARTPASRLLHYAKRRLERMPQTLCPGRLPVTTFSERIEHYRICATFIEKALLTHQDLSRARGWSTFNRLKQALDALCAVIDAAPARRPMKFFR